MGTQKKLQEQLAEHFYVSSRTVSRWETGSNMPDVEMLIELADFYDVDIREIIDGEIANSDEQKMAKLFLRSYKEKMESEGCDEQLKALELWINTKSNLLILGSQGTGKTTLAKEYLKTLSKKDRAKVLVVAPTWKAVTNLSGTTVHRAFELSCSIQQDTPIVEVGLCRIMFLWNGKQYKRGDFAMIESFSDDGIDVTMEKTGERIQVQRETWTLTNGTKYTQYPMCLACAITVHKAQGCTFDEVNIDRGNGFWMPGQLYVAMSRCRTPYGIHLVKPLKEKDVHADLKALGMMINDTDNEDDE